MYIEYKKRVLFIYITLILLSICLLIKLFDIQILKHKKLKDEYNKIHKGYRIYTLPRGTIFDRDGNILAMSIESISIYGNSKKINKKEHLRLSRILNIDKKVLKSNKGFIWLKRRVPFSFAEKIKQENIPGINFLIEHKRYYPYKAIGGALLGFVKFEDNARKIIGLSGIEGSFNKYLEGGSLNLNVTKDGLGRILYTKERFPPELKGDDLYLSISGDIQYVAYSELKKTCEEYEAKGGVCIIGNPKTGEILAMTQYPGFDPNVYSSYNPGLWKEIPKENLKNKAISWVFEPGSLFKPIIAAILIEEKLVKEDDRFFCSGEYKVGNKIIRCSHAHKDQSFKDVLKNSCNVGMSKAIERLDDDKLLFYLSQFGFGTKTNIGIIEEENGLLRKGISKIRKANISFGYGISATPIQIYLAMSAIFNDGIILSPIVVRSILSNNKIIKEYQPTPSSYVLTADTANRVSDMMVSIVEEGTGKNAKMEGYKIAGKTGTAEKAIKGRYDPSSIIASFIGFLKEENQQILILVILDEPKKAHYASIVAAPCFRRIGEKIIFLERINGSSTLCR